METCERLVVTGRFNPRNPGHLIATSYYELKENKEQIIGNLLKYLKVTLCNNLVKISFNLTF